MGEKFRRLLMEEVYALTGANEGEKRTLSEWEPYFDEADTKILANMANLAPEAVASARLGLKYGVKRRRRADRHNERSHLKKLGGGFRDFNNSVTLAESINRDLFKEFTNWVQEDKDSYASVIGLPELVGGSTLRVLTLLALHARGCTIASEVSLLAQRGFLEGAHARARSLYELTTIAAFLTLKDSEPFELTERYHLSALVERRREVTVTGEGDPFNDVAGLEDAIRNKWGPDFFKSYGWAIPGVGDGKGRKVTFRDIETSLGFDVLRHSYVTMNNAVHAGAMAITTRFDSRNPFRNQTGSEVGYHSAAWVMGTAMYFFRIMQVVVIRQIADLINSDDDLQLGPLVGLCESSEDFFDNYAGMREPRDEASEEER